MHLRVSPAWPLDGTQATLPLRPSGANTHRREDPRKRDPGKLTRSSTTPKPSGQSSQPPLSPWPTHLVFSGLSLPLSSHATPRSSHKDFCSRALAHCQARAWDTLPCSFLSVRLMATHPSGLERGLLQEASCLPPPHECIGRSSRP